MNKIVNYLGVFLKWRRLILFNTIIITVLVLAISFVLPRRYTATAQVLPPSDEGEMFGFTSLLGTPGTATRLMSRLRLGSFGAATASDLMAGILGSRTVMERVAERCSVAIYYKINPKKTEQIIRQIKKMTKVSIGDEGIVKVSVEAKRPHLAAKIANSYIEELDNFLRSSNISRGHVMRVFLEKRVAEVESALMVAAESLRVFQSRHKVVTVDDETKAAIEAYAKLKSQAYLKQAELDAVKDVASPDNPYFINLQRTVRAFSDQLRQLEQGSSTQGFGVGFGVSFKNLPEVAQEFARRYRDYEILEETYAMLYQQYEYAKILEARDAPTLTVLDYAVPPQRHSFPRRSIITIVAFFFSLAFGATLAFILEYFHHLQETKPEEYERWRNLWQEIRGVFWRRGKRGKATEKVEGGRL
ncbi:MAG: Wzz/FepE/Etk N-terminal domain-containing protein [candidate division WOR-3 bacterium]